MNLHVERAGEGKETFSALYSTSAWAAQLEAGGVVFKTAPLRWLVTWCWLPAESLAGARDKGAPVSFHGGPLHRMFGLP